MPERVEGLPRLHFRSVWQIVLAKAFKGEFIRASEEEAEARLSEQRKQLDAMAAAQAEREKALHEAEEALNQAADAQLMRAVIRNIGLVAVGGLAVVAALFALLANQQRMTAEKQRHQADTILGSATNIVARVQKGMDSETKHEAFELFQAGAEHGNASSMRNLGIAYRNGLGVPQDYAKAREWFEKAAAGDPEAMVDLGTLYRNGLGVPQDYAKARAWYEMAAAVFEMAAAKDNAAAMVDLGMLYQNGQGVPQDYAKAREWFEKAAAKNNAAAMVDLGMLYVQGHGVTQDYDKAREWFEKAAAQGNASARMALERLPSREAETAGRYAEALRLVEALAAKLETVETNLDGEPGNQTAETLAVVTWLALFAKEFTKALTVADRAHTLSPNNLLIETNRAHALMFMGHDEEAKALYLAHKGEVQERSGKLWEQIIAEDFAKFREAGLTHPMMADIEKELGIRAD